jgi:hypothetical protein
MRSLAALRPPAAILAAPIAAQRTSTRVVRVPEQVPDSTRARSDSGSAGVRVTPPARSGGASSWAPGPISTLRLYVRTGADDLRRESQVRAFLLLHDGRRVESKPLNRGERGCAGIPRGGEASYEWDFTPGARLRPQDIHRVGLAVVTGRRMISEAPDGWDLARITVEYSLPGGDDASRGEPVTRPLLDRGGAPVHHFRGQGETSWEIARGGASRTPVRAARPRG